jgi:hypothetical protein
VMNLDAVKRCWDCRKAASLVVDGFWLCQECAQKEHHIQELARERDHYKGLYQSCHRTSAKLFESCDRWRQMYDKAISRDRA